MPLIAIVLLVVNDHILKQAFHNDLTGKLSDVAGLCFFPLFLQALVEIAWTEPFFHVRRQRQVLVLAILLTGSVFCAVKLTASGAWAYQYGLAVMQWPWRALATAARTLATEAVWIAPPISPVQLTKDATDLLALPALVLAFLAGSSRSSALPPQPGLDVD